MNEESDALINLQNRLDAARRQIGASSCTFYVRDAHWRNEFRLAAMSGVSLPEPMYGLLAPDAARRRVVDGAHQLFVSDISELGDLEDLPALDGVPEDLKFLFMSFAGREGVRAFARLMQVTDSGVEAVLFVNYREPTSFDHSLKRELAALLATVAIDHVAVAAALGVDDARWLSEAARVVSPFLSIANVDIEDRTEEDYNRAVLEATIAALNVEACVGTIHLYDAEEQTLTLCGYAGAPTRDFIQTHAVHEGDGVPSWVARRRRWLLVADVDSSEFRRLRRLEDGHVKSQLAVPIEAGDQLIGVLSLQSASSYVFKPHHIRSVWYAANRSAIFHQVKRQAEAREVLLDLCARAAVGTDEGREALRRLTILAQGHLRSSFVDITCFDPDSGVALMWAASYSGEYSRIRPDGWTQYCRRRQVPLWFSDVSSMNGVDSISHWHDSRWNIGLPAGDTPPTSINSAVIEQGVRSVLGVPIVLRNECVGVAWIKYKRVRPKPPNGLVRSALGLGAEAALMLDSIARHEIDLQERANLNHVARNVFEGVSERWRQEHCNTIDLYAQSLPFHAEQGGDFHARKRIDADTTAVLLLDGEGHGIRGLLHLLPLLSAFETSGRSHSPMHVIGQLRLAAKASGVSAVALYFVVAKAEKKRWLILAGAGDAQLLLFQSDWLGRWSIGYFPKEHGPALGYDIEGLSLEERIEVEKGNVVVAFTDGVAPVTDSQWVAQLVLNRLSAEATAPEIAALIAQQVRERRMSSTRSDDATIVVGVVE